jgi:asparagine synthase (glutamine-hydrolysing)
MSGIAGIIHFDGRPVEPGQVEAMTAAMHCRGPDGIDHWRRGSVALGQCMLRTTPESLEEKQPLTKEDEGLILVIVKYIRSARSGGFKSEVQRGYDASVAAS